jgi:hypothetical protein
MQVALKFVAPIRNFLFIINLVLISFSLKYFIHISILICIIVRCLCGICEVYMENFPEGGTGGSGSGGPSGNSGGPSNPGGGPDPNYLKKTWNVWLASKNTDWWNKMPDPFSKKNDIESLNEEPDPNYDNWSKQELIDEFRRLRNLNGVNRKEMIVELNKLGYNISELIDRLPDKDKNLEHNNYAFFIQKTDELTRELQALGSSSGETQRAVSYQELSNNNKFWEVLAITKRKDTILKQLYSNREDRVFWELADEKANLSQILIELGVHTRRMRTISETIRNMR